MKIYVYKSEDEIKEVLSKKTDFWWRNYYEDIYNVQYDFCSMLEREYYGEMRFLEHPNVKKYLNNLNITYKGNYIIDSPDWGAGNRDGEQFVTYMKENIQLACMMAFKPSAKYWIKGTHLLWPGHLKALPEELEVYWELDKYSDFIFLADYYDDEIEMIIEGKSSKEFHTRYEFVHFLIELNKQRPIEFTKELDAKVFNEEMFKGFVPYECSLLEYVKKFPYEDYDLKDLKDNFSDKNMPMVKVNGENIYDGRYRRYPIHWLFQKDDKWYYATQYSIKNPLFIELLENILFDQDLYSFEQDKYYDVSNADKIYAMVLDCDEECEADHYWDYVSFFIKYDKVTNEIEICDKNKSLIEFHELLQNSELLFNT